MHLRPIFRSMGTLKLPALSQQILPKHPQWIFRPAILVSFPSRWSISRHDPLFTQGQLTAPSPKPSFPPTMRPSLCYLNTASLAPHDWAPSLASSVQSPDVRSELLILDGFPSLLHEHAAGAFAAVFVVRQLVSSVCCSACSCAGSWVGGLESEKFGAEVGE